MSAVLLSIHVLAAIVFIGPVTVAASMFPPRARTELDHPTESGTGVLIALHRITRVYAVGGIAVVAFGIGTATSLGVLDDYWVWASMVLTAAAAALLGLRLVPEQARVLDALDQDAARRAAVMPRARQLSMTTGIFALTWAVVVVLMIVRPGSTTGV